MRREPASGVVVGEGWAVVLVLVSGVAWYVTAADDAYVLPAETVVPLPRVVAALAPGRMTHMLLPQGALALRRRALPVTPVPVDRIFPIGSAEVPWTPDPERWRVGEDLPILSRNWHHLFRERALFSPWGDAADRTALAAFERRFGPLPTFREGPDRRHIAFKYPQRLDPTLCYRLNQGYLKLADPAPFAPVAVVQDRLRLAGLEQDDVIVFGPGDFGWTARAYATADDAAVGQASDTASPRTLEDLEDFVARRGRFWRLEPARRELNLVLPGGD